MSRLAVSGSTPWREGETERGRHPRSRRRRWTGSSGAGRRVRRRVQLATLGRRGHKDDPLCRIRRTLLTRVEHLTDRQRARLDKWLPLGDPNSEVEVTWHVYQQVRSIYTATSPAAGRKTAEKVLESLHTCPIPEVTKLGRTLRKWRTEILAYFDTGGMSNGGTEAINGVIEKTRRLAHGFRNFTNYRIRILLAADGTYRRPSTKSRSAERADPG